MFNWPILIYGQTGFPVRPKSWPDIGQLSGQSDIRPNSTSFFIFKSRGAKYSFSKYLSLYFSSIIFIQCGPGPENSAELVAEFEENGFCEKKWKFLEKVGNPVTTQQWPNLFSNRFSYPRHAYIPNFNMIGQKIVPKIEKKVFFHYLSRVANSIFWKHLSPCFMSIISIQCGSGPENSAELVAEFEKNEILEKVMKKVGNPVMIHQANRDQSCKETRFHSQGMLKFQISYV